MSKHVKSIENFTDNGRGLVPVLQLKRSKFGCRSSSKLLIKAHDAHCKDDKNRNSLDLQLRSAVLNSVSPNRISSRSPGSQLIDLKLKSEQRLVKNNSLSKSFYEIKETLNEKKKNSNDAKVLLFKIRENIRNAKGRNQLQVFETSQQVFEEIIEKDLKFAAVLSEVKEAYEEYIKKLQDSQKVKNLEDQVKDLQSQLVASKDVIRSFERNLDLISKENLQISKDLERSEEICTELQRKLCKITLFDLAECPKDELTWKSLLTENQTLYQSFLKQSEELSSFQYKEKKLFQLVIALKQRGFPVEEVYQNEIVNKKHSNCASSVSSSSETDSLESSRPKPRAKPSIIPLLSLPVPFCQSSDDF